MKLIKQSSESYYMQVKNHLLREIESGKYPVQSPIPSEKELCDLFSVSRTTIRKATDELVSEGKLFRMPGKGTYVAPHQQSNTTDCYQTGNILFLRCIHDASDDNTRVKNDIFYPTVLNGVEKAASNYGYNCMYKTIDETKLEPNPLEQIGLSVDGIVCGEIHTEKFLDVLVSCDLPVVLVSPSVSTTKVDIVDVDNVGGAISAVNRLIETGRTCIAYLGGPSESIPAMLRERGYKEALRNAGLVPDSNNVCSGGWRLEDGYNMALELMQREARPDGIFASSDLVAIGALTAIRELGLEVPGDVAIIGFDDIDMAQEIKPALTTVNIDKKALGRVAFDLLHQRITCNRDFPLRTTLPTTLVKRQTG